MKSVCLTVEQLQLFLQGLPDEQTVEQIADHLESCPDCARRLAEIDIDTQPATELSTQDALPFVDESECEHLAGELARTRPNHLPFIDAPTESMQLSSIDDYIIERRLGRGGMGTVYLARQANLGTKVAVKFVRSDRKQTPEAIRRFEREILSIGKLNHPNIVGAIDAGEWDGQPYLVMDYIEGIDLSRWIQSTGPLEPDVAMEIVRQIASALEVIHKSGRIHRDVKLSNVMVDRNGSVKLLDLGLTREISPDPFDETRSIDPETSGDLDLNSSQPLTRSGQVVGTLEYLAPEQFQQGAAAHSAIDIYGLGVTAFYLLTGRYPKSPSAQRSSSGSAQRSSGGSDESILELRPDLPNEVAGLISSALALDPKDRPTANEISRSISQRVQASELALKVIQLTGNPIERAHRSGRSATLILNVAVGFIVATMLSVCAWLIVTSKGPPTEAQPRTAQVQQSVTDGPSGSQSTTSPPAAPVNPSNDSFNKVDLAALVEPTRDSRYGNWSRENGQLVSKIDASNFLRIPYRLPDFYKFEIVAKRVSRSESLRIFLHTGGTRFSVMFDGWPKDGFLSGIEQLDGYRLNYRRKHRCVGKVLPDEKSFKIEIDVKEHPAGVSIDVSIDGKQITSWAGNPERIAQVSTVNEFQFGTPGLLVFEKTSFVVDEISVTPSVEGGRVVDLGDVNMWLEWKGFKTQYESDEQAQEPKLVAVDATSSGGMTGDALSKLDEHESLRTISIGNCEVDHEQLNRMRLPNLQEMNLSNCSFDPGQFPKLERLVAKASSLRVDDIAFLHRFKSLLYLDLSVTPIRDLRTIVLPSSLERLELSGTALTGDDLKHMPPMPQLLDLDLNHTRVDHIDGLTRARFPMLRHIELLDSELTIDDHRELVSRFPDATITTGFGAIELISEVNPFQRLDLSEDSVSQYVPLERAEPLRLSLRVPQEFELTLSGDHKVGSKLLLSVPLEGVGMTTIEIDNARKTAVCGKNRP
ncbi:MAG: protein kinase, partial [Planctomycetota bacterium]